MFWLITTKNFPNSSFDVSNCAFLFNLHQYKYWICKEIARGLTLTFVCKLILHFSKERYWHSTQKTIQNEIVDIRDKIRVVWDIFVCGNSVKEQNFLYNLHTFLKNTPNSLKSQMCQIFDTKLKFALMLQMNRRERNVT